jgi:hypothetical protein
VPRGAHLGGSKKRARRYRAAGFVLPLALIAAALAPPPLPAQRFGRWWWDARVGLGQRQNDSLVDGRRLRRFDEQEVELSLGLNGYLGHPAIGDFRLGLDLLLAEYDGARLADTDSFGAELVLNLLPQRAYPSSFFFRRSVLDNTAEEGVDPFSLLGIVDESNRWGGRFRMRQGPFRGTLLGFEHTDVTFLNPLSDEDVRDRQFLDWSRSGKKLNHHLRIEHNEQDYGTVDLEIEDHTANFDQNGNLTPTVRWELSGIAVLRDLQTAGQTVSTEDYRLRTRLTKDLRQRDQLELRYDAGEFDDGRDLTRDVQALSAFYRWRPRERWEIAPFAAYSRQSADGFEQTTPRAGLALSWRRSQGELTTGATARAGFGEIERREGSETLSDSQTSYALSGSVRHGRGNGFRKEIEGEVSRNEIRFGRDPVLDLPDVDLLPRGLTTEDLLRSRATLGWRWDSKYANAWAEWSRRESSNGLALDDFEAETLRAAIQGGTGELTVQLEAGETTASESQVGERDVRFATAVASWRPLRRLRLQGLYRIDDRELILAPDIESERLEASLEWRVGAIVIEAQVFDRRQELSGGSESTNRGFRWGISRRLAGWLPIVTGAGRRGVIR